MCNLNRMCAGDGGDGDGGGGAGGGGYGNDENTA